jgi:hypothetical protein
MIDCQRLLQVVWYMLVKMTCMLYSAWERCRDSMRAYFCLHRRAIVTNSKTSLDTFEPAGLSKGGMQAPSREEALHLTQTGLYVSMFPRPGGRDARTTARLDPSRV